jgi:hypothetical protein
MNWLLVVDFTQSPSLTFSLYSIMLILHNSLRLPFSSRFNFTAVPVPVVPSSAIGGCIFSFSTYFTIPFLLFVLLHLFYCLFSCMYFIVCSLACKGVEFDDWRSAAEQNR